MPLGGGYEGREVMVGFVSLRTFVELTSAAGELRCGPVEPTFLSPFGDGLEPSAQELALLLGRIPGGEEYAAEVMHLRVG